MAIRKIWKIYFWIIGILILLVALGTIIPIVILEISWTLFWIPFSIIFIGAIITGILIFASKNKKTKKSEEKEKIGEKAARERIIEYMKYESDSPDNFIIISANHGNMGQGTPTPMIIFSGYGYEILDKRVILFNTMNGKISELPPNPSEKEIKEAIRIFPDFPESEYEQLRTEYDPFGKPIASVKSRIQKTYQQKKEEIEQKEADEKNVT